MDTRDCFVFDPIVVVDKVNMGPGRENVIRKRFYFDPEVLPDNYGRYLDEEKLKENPDLIKDFKMYPVGATSYENFFTHDEMLKMERQIEETEKLCSDSKHFSNSKFSRCIFTRDCLIDIQEIKADTNEIFLWIQIYVDKRIIN
jgi:hypothetical protein